MLQTLIFSNLIRIFYQYNSNDMMKNGKNKVTLLSSFPSKNEQLSKESFSLDTVSDIPLKFPNAKINNYEEEISLSKVLYENSHSLDSSFISLSTFLERQKSLRMLGPFSKSYKSLEVPFTLASNNHINKTAFPHCSDKLANKDYEASDASDFHKGGFLDLINFVYWNFNSTFEYNEAIKTGIEVVSIINAEVESPSYVAFTLSSPESLVSFPNDRLSSSLFPCLKTSEARICYISKQLLELNLLSRPILRFTPLHCPDEIVFLSINDDI
uniref:Uncharacterized protein n=1 Tax=Polytomella parva TaxID=51329 RepID=A0A7S0VJ04_9CHLO|mmetsp:Transcript_5309/g.9872  ORF Transcript_5309/g.9872 Transcript_5309/m.9872 type:complete len:270 (+) Transcript_5309:940-1749(+)